MTESTPALAGGIYFNQQNTDGGWGQSTLGPNSESSVYVTSLVLSAIAPYRTLYNIESNISYAHTYLLEQKGDDALWADTFVSAQALIALVGSLSELDQVADSLSKLRDSQLSDGSWGSDVFTTALALRAIKLAEKPPSNPGLSEIIGTVLDGKTQQPLVGATVTLTGPTSKSIVTSVGGSFRFNDLVSGNYSLQVFKDGYATVTGSTVAVPGGKTDFGSILMLPENNVTVATIKGEVTDADSGDPISGAVVTLSGAASATANTASDGTYQFSSVSPGSVSLTVTKTGYSTATADANLTAGNLFIFSPSLLAVPEPITALKGVVTEGDTGQPLSGVTITVTGSSNSSTISDNQGAYEITGLNSGDITIVASLDGYDEVVATATLHENNIIIFSPAMYQEASTPPESNKAGITGTVVDVATGHPIADVTIEATFGIDTFNLTTDTNGSFQLGGISELDGSLMFTKEAYITNEFGVTLQPLKVLDIGLVRLVREDVQALLPDMVVTAVDAGTTTTDPYTLEVSGTVTATVHNRGTSEAATGLTLQAFYDADQDGQFNQAIDTDLGQGSMAAGLGVNDNLEVVITIQGSLPYRDAPISVWVDSDQSLIESSEQNNVNKSSSGCVDAGQQGILDLTAALLRVDEQSTGGLRLSLRVGNSGAKATEFGLPVSFYEGDPASGGTLIGSVEMQALEADSFTDVFLNDVPTLAGGQPIYAVVDQDNQVAECNEDNNIVHIPAPDLKPNLTVKKVDDEGLVTDLATGGVSGSIESTVYNHGTAEAGGGFKLLAFHDANSNGKFDDGEIQLGTAVVDGALAVDANETVTIQIAGIMPFRDAPITVWVDSTEQITELDETDNTSSAGFTCRIPKKSRLYTLNADFNTGTLINVDTAVPDQLQLDDTTRQFPFIWMPASSRGTIIKVDTLTGEVLGEYLSSPNGRGRNPSRSTVDKAGNVWAGNRDESSGGRGSVVQVGLFENGQCEDRNKNGVIDTSTGLGDIRPWTNAGGADNNGGVSTAADECIIKYVRVAGDHVRHVSIDENNNIWTAGNFGSDNAFNLVENKTGNIIASFDVGCGGYGGLVDGNGVLWSSNRDPGGVRLLRYDTKKTLTTADDTYRCLASPDSYGVGVDSQGNIWNSQHASRRVYKFDSSGNRVGEYYSAGYRSRGVAVTADDHVWIAHSSSNYVGRHTPNGALAAQIGVGQYPTGVSVDAAGKVWATNMNSHTASRINPATNKVDLTVSLGSGAGPYTYGDMTGSVLQGAPEQGTWSVVYDSGMAGTPWGTIEWNDAIFGDGKLTITAETSEDGISFSAVEPVSQGTDLNLPNGRYIRVTVGFDRATGGQSPVLYDLTVFSEPEGVADLTASRLHVLDHGAGQPLDLVVRVGNGGAVASPDNVTVAFYQGEPGNGGTLLGTKSIDAIDPNSYQDITLEGITGLVDATVIHVVVDADDAVAECDELNNHMQTPLPASTLGRIVVATDAPVYGPNSPVVLQGSITNAGAVSGQFTAQLQVEDSNGAIVAQFPVKDLGTLSGGQAVTLTEDWNSASYLAGNYLLRGKVFGEDGSVQDEHTADFRIQYEAGGPAVTLRTTTDRPEYHTTDTVEISDLVRNVTSNFIIEDALLRVTVADPVGDVIFTHDIALGQLIPGRLRDIITPLQLKNAALGQYTVTGVVLSQDNTELATDSANFTVSHGLDKALTGDVKAQLDVLIIGETQICTDRITNTGALSIDDLPIRQLVVRMDQEQEMGMAQSVIALAGEQTATLVRSIETRDWEAGHYACIVQAYIDNSSKWVTLDSDNFQVKEPPIKIDSTFETGSRGRLLVLLDDDNCGCWKLPPLGGHLFCEANMHKHGCDDRGRKGCFDQVRGWFDHKDPKWTQHCTQLCLYRGCGEKVNMPADVWVQGNVVAKETAMPGFTFGHQPNGYGEFGNFKLTSCDSKQMHHGGHGGYGQQCESDPYGPQAAPDLSQQRAYLESLLQSAGWSYTIVTDAEAFTRELRSGGYQVYALFNERVKLPEQIQKELREAVNRGEGLLVAGNHDERNGRLNEVLGIQWRGHRNDAQGVEFTESPLELSGEENFAYADQVARIEGKDVDIVASFLTSKPQHPGGFGFGWPWLNSGKSGGMGCNGKQFNTGHDNKFGGHCNDRPDKCGQGKNHDGGCGDKKKIAVTTHDYGQGKAMYAAFDLLAQATAAGDTSLFADLIRSSLQHVHPQNITAVPGGVVPVTLKLSNQGMATPGRVVITLPADSSVVDSGAAIEEGDSLIWTFDLGEAQELELNFWLRLPETAGPVTIDAQIQTGVDPDFQDYAALNLIITPEARGDLAQLLAELEALQRNPHYWPVSMSLKKAQHYLDAESYCKALKYLIKATDGLIRIDHEQAAELRLQVDWVIWDTSRRLWAAILQAQSEETGTGCNSAHNHNKPGKECKK